MKNKSPRSIANRSNVNGLNIKIKIRSQNIKNLKGKKKLFE
jgi:hypothetical protein